MTKYRTLISIFLLSIIISFFGGCSKPRPLGKDYSIRVLTYPELWNQAEPLIREIFERIERTPQEEKLFTIIPQEAKNYQRYKNLLFLSTLDATDDLSKMINSNLSEAALSKVNEGEFIFTKTEVWAQDQKVMFLVAPDIATLLELMQANKDNIFFQFENHWQEFHKNILYSTKDNYNIEKHLLQNYGWMLEVPADYRLEIQSARDRFVLFHRKVPLRWIAVFWEEASDPNIISKDYCISKRNEFADSFYEGEVVADKFEPVTTTEVNFQNRRALYLRGLWENNKKVGGGPFRMYCFFDEQTERIYFIDMHMFAPDLKKSKMHYLRQMDIIAQTFKTNLEISVDELP